jgi:S-formylglutathione hydrolase FrmB
VTTLFSRLGPWTRALAPLLLLVSLSAGPAAAEVRQGSFESPVLGRQVSYVVDLPPSYDESTKSYGVVYALHGLFESEGFWERRGLAREMQRLRESGRIPELIVVAVDGGNSFFVDGPQGRYQDLVTEDLIAHVESSYRVQRGPRQRALLGISMGGYAALRIAFTRPGLFSAVATHSAMLLEAPPSAAQGARKGHMRAFHGVFGDPIDAALWKKNNPLALAAELEHGRATGNETALYMDCGAEDRYGLARGHRALGRVLDERGVPHVLSLPPGDHGYEFVRSRLRESLSFIVQAFNE